MSKETLQKDWLKINKIQRDLRWLIYDDSYKKYPELKEALEKLNVVSEQMKKEIEGNNV